MLELMMVCDLESKCEIYWNLFSDYNFKMWVICRCYSEYFGERCGEKSMKTQGMVDSDLSKIALAAIAAFVSAMTFTAIAVFITIL